MHHVGDRPGRHAARPVTAAIAPGTGQATLPAVFLRRAAYRPVAATARTASPCGGHRGRGQATATGVHPAAGLLVAAAPGLLVLLPAPGAAVLLAAPGVLVLLRGAGALALPGGAGGRVRLPGRVAAVLLAAPAVLGHRGQGAATGVHATARRVVTLLAVLRAVLLLAVLRAVLLLLVLPLLVLLAVGGVRVVPVVPGRVRAGRAEREDGRSRRRGHEHASRAHLTILPSTGGQLALRQLW